MAQKKTNTSGMNWIGCPQICIMKPQNPVWLYLETDPRSRQKLSKVTRVGPLSDRTGVLIRRGKRPERKVMWGHSKKATVHKPGRETTPEKGCPLKGSTSQVRMGLNRKKEASPAVMPMHYALPRIPCWWQERKSWSSGLQVYHQNQCGKSSRLHSILPF